MLRVLWFLCSVALLSATHAVSAAAPGRPNIVFILVDDLRFDALSSEGHPFVTTPNVDRLASQGARFARAFVTASLCSPSRASFLSGLYAHTHEVWGNVGRDLAPGTPTFPSLLRERAGYTTAFIGKWHMARHAAPRQGFDRWVSFKGQGRYRDNTLNVDGQTVESTGYVSDVLTDYSIEFVRAARARPFVLYLSHKAVHAPFTPPERYRERFEDIEIRPPTEPADELEKKFDWGRRVPKTWRENVKNYMRSVLAIDDSVGRVVAEIDRLGLTSSTAVVFTSDNGYFHGEHGGLWDKRAAYEEALRIPLIVRFPPLVAAGSTVDRIVLNVDFAPTFLELGGVAAPASMQGTSWLRALRGETLRDAFLYEYFRERDPRFDRPSTLALRTERYKYIVYPDRAGSLVEIYDLELDPGELHNIAVRSDAAAIVKKLEARFEAEKRALRFRFPEGVPRDLDRRHAR